MAERVKDHIWQSIHTDYLEFAILSCQSCQESPSELNPGVHIKRNITNIIRYSYDCLEASIEFVYHMGRLEQLPIAIQDNWLSRTLQRKWNNLSLSDRIGMLSYAWTGQTFWRSDNQYKLFEELKKVRDGLTHPVPFGTELEKEILLRQRSENGTVLTESLAIGEPKQIGSANMNFSPKEAVAGFNQNPSLLGNEDAERALEIMLCHLSKLENTFFGRVTTWFAFYERKSKGLLSTKDLLSRINRRFESIWAAV